MRVLAIECDGSVGEIIPREQTFVSSRLEHEERLGTNSSARVSNREPPGVSDQNGSSRGVRVSLSSREPVNFEAVDVGTPDPVHVVRWDIIAPLEVNLAQGHVGCALAVYPGDVAFGNRRLHRCRLEVDIAADAVGVWTVRNLEADASSVTFAISASSWA